MQLHEVVRESIRVSAANWEKSLESLEELGEDDMRHQSEAVKAAENERKTLARKEGKAVKLLRINVFIVLIITATLVSFGIHTYVKYDQKQDFEDQYTANALKITESFRVAFGSTFGAIDTLAASVTSYSLTTGNKFPNITIPNFEVLGMNARTVSGSTSLWWLPLVTNENRAGWEAYTNVSNTWYESSLMSEFLMRANQDKRMDLFDENAAQQEPPPQIPFRAEIFGYDRERMPEGTGPHLPIWQTSPIIPNKGLFFNFDFFNRTIIRPLLGKALQSEQVVLGPVVDLQANDEEKKEDTAGIFNAILQLSQYRHKAGEFMNDALTAGTYPVFTSFTSDRVLGGLLYFNIYWRLLFQDSLPQGADGYICVIETTLDQKFTYQLDGPDVRYLGPGDLHDTQYDYLELSEDMIHAVNEYSSPETQSYTSVPIAEDFVGYKLRVYPSSTTEDKFVNNNPMKFTVVVVAIFLFTSLVFVAYDCYVAKRQKIVMSKAVASSAIVSSLFPSTVRDKLYQETQTTKTTRKSDMFRIGVENIFSSQNDETGRESSESFSRPMADVFPETTIYFADLAGFTAWSSKRTPCEVFELLEALFGAFDRAAYRRKVFKVETIGDCYVAVTGLPEPQVDHAERMVKFARDSMVSMSKTVLKLKDRLGDDTANLEMRVGLHSGSVTAGVLRGSKGRFQLFGDTVNTASRMESNGVRGRIHVSQATADALIARGKKAWLTAREDKIVAKGKGEMQTYFVDVLSEKTVASNDNSSANGEDSEFGDIDILNVTTPDQALDDLEKKLHSRLSI